MVKKTQAQKLQEVALGPNILKITGVDHIQTVASDPTIPIWKASWGIIPNEYKIKLTYYNWNAVQYLDAEGNEISGKSASQIVANEANDAAAAAKIDAFNQAKAEHDAEVDRAAEMVTRYTGSPLLPTKQRIESDGGLYRVIQWKMAWGYPIPAELQTLKIYDWSRVVFIPIPEPPPMPTISELHSESSELIIKNDKNNNSIYMYSAIAAILLLFTRR